MVGCLVRAAYLVYIFCMNKLIYFIKRIYTSLLFFTIEILAIYLYATSSPYTVSQLRGFNHHVLGWSSTLFTKMGNYFSLDRDNIALNERIAELESRLAAYQSLYPQSVETDLDISPSMYVAAKVVSNSLNKQQNYLVVNKGLDDNVRIGMSVLSPEGYAVGYITNCSQKFSIATSILSTSLKISSRLTTDRSMCLAYWRGGDATEFQVTDISKYAKFEKGETVEAMDFSEYFPSGTIIGTVESIEMNDDQTMYNCTLRLAADFSRIDNVILVDNRDIDQVRVLKREPIATTEINEQDQSAN